MSPEDVDQHVDTIVAVIARVLLTQLHPLEALAVGADGLDPEKEKILRDGLKPMLLLIEQVIEQGPEGEAADRIVAWMEEQCEKNSAAGVPIQLAAKLGFGLPANRKVEPKKVKKRARALRRWKKPVPALPLHPDEDYEDA